ncbi:hypothetical protein TcYC6_0090130 [Trypanosoma cruzi]|nr:hypothetical protein TcYC6_0090130 [Trypanosoma cruzi]
MQHGGHFYTASFIAFILAWQFLLDFGGIWGVATICQFVAVTLPLLCMAFRLFFGSRWGSHKVHKGMPLDFKRFLGAIRLCAAGYFFSMSGMQTLFLLVSVYNLYVTLKKVSSAGMFWIPIRGGSRAYADSSKPRTSSLRPDTDQQKRCVIMDEGPHFNRIARGCLL